MPTPLRAILAATDLGAGSEAVVLSAARLAARAGAELHLLHSLDFPWAPSETLKLRTSFRDEIGTAERRLRELVERALPKDPPPASETVVVRMPDEAILDRAREVSADLIVMGPHRGGAAGAHFLGTTADRVIRTADVPCLVVREPLLEELRRIGVPLDFSDPSGGALETALAWALQLAPGADAAGGDAPEIRVAYFGWPVERFDNPEIEVQRIRPELERQIARAVDCIPGAESVRTRVDVLWANDPMEATVRWSQDSGIDLIAMGTHGHRGLRRALIGSMASRVARRTPRPVLLVPPSLWCGSAHAPRLDRVLIATDFSEPSMEAARWSTRHLAPGADHRLVHVLEVPEPPAALAGRYGSREELLRTAGAGARARLDELRAMLDGEAPLTAEAHEGHPAERLVALADAVDLVVMAGYGRSDVRRSAWTLLGTTVERVLRSCPAPVLVTRGDLAAPPRVVLAAVDGSDVSRRALSWAGFLAARHDASLEVLYVETPAIHAYGELAHGSGAGPFAAARMPAPEVGWIPYRESWLREEVRRAEIDPDRVRLRVVIGSPAAEIVEAQESSGADLIVMGTRGRGSVGRTVLGSVAGAVLRTASCPVLVVGDPARAQTGASGT